MKDLYFAAHLYRHDPDEVVALHSEEDRDRFCDESISEYTNTRYYLAMSLDEILTNVDFIFDDYEFRQYAQDCPYTWWHFESRKTESEIDLFKTYEQIAKATQLDKIADAYDRVAW